MEDNKTIFFTTVPGFCPDCGSILPLLSRSGGVTCYVCRQSWDPEVYGDMSVTETIKFKKEQTLTNKLKQKENENEPEGPVVERKCPKCNNNEMSYATLQLRSADEGQTVFYTCTKCKYKETEQS